VVTQISALPTSQLRKDKSICSGQASVRPTVVVKQR